MFKISNITVNLSLRLIIFLSLLLVLLAYLITLGLAPANRINDYAKTYFNDSLYQGKYDSVYNTPELMLLLKEKAYKKALLKLSESDSIQLIVNLRDSVVCLSIKGVLIHETVIQDFKIDKLLRRLPAHLYSYMFDHPLRIISQNASIVKEPIVVREAPGNPEEAENNAYKPDTLIQNPAFLLLKCDRGINVFFEQGSNPSFHDKWIGAKFKSYFWLKNAAVSLVKFFSFRRQDYKPEIVVKMPAEDLRAVYRALPVNASLVLIYTPDR